MVLDFSNIILGFDSMHATVERAEKMVRREGLRICV
jgi:hypothetical protein